MRHFVAVRCQGLQEIALAVVSTLHRVTKRQSDSAHDCSPINFDMAHAIDIVRGGGLWFCLVSNELEAPSCGPGSLTAVHIILFRPPESVLRWGLWSVRNTEIKQFELTDALRNRSLLLIE